MPAPASEARKHFLRRRMMIAAVLANAVLAGLKFAAWHVTASSAVLADALESIVNVAASGFALYAVIAAAKPPDRRHPYGHGEIELFSAGFEGAMIILAAAVIVHQSLHASGIRAFAAGLPFVVAVLLGTAALGIFQVAAGRRLKSIAIEADGRHAIVDGYTTAAVLVGMIVVRFTRLRGIDTGVAMAIAAYIACSGARLLKTAANRLLHAYDSKLTAAIAQAAGECSMTHLRAFRTAERVHTDFRLLLPPKMSLADADAEARRIERSIRRRMPEVRDILICVAPKTIHHGDTEDAERGESGKNH